MLLEIDGVRVLTDPVWGTRASPLRLAGPKRFQPVPVPLQAMPPLDVVVISHDHYDHLDYPTIRALAETEVPFVTSLGVGAHLEAWGVPPERIIELDWWESHRLPNRELTMTAAPSQHFSGRGLSDRNATLWSSIVIRSPRHSVFFSGDTGLTTEYRAIRERLGPVRPGDARGRRPFIRRGATSTSGRENALAGACRCSAAARSCRCTGARSTSPCTPGTSRRRRCLLAPKGGAQLVMPRLGEPVEPAQVERVEPWWRAVETVSAKIEADVTPLQKAVPWPLD